MAVTDFATNVPVVVVRDDLGTRQRLNVCVPDRRRGVGADKLVVLAPEPWSITNHEFVIQIGPRWPNRIPMEIARPLNEHAPEPAHRLRKRIARKGAGSGEAAARLHVPRSNSAGGQRLVFDLRCL